MKVLCPGKPLGSGQTGMVGYPTCDKLTSWLNFSGQRAVCRGRKIWLLRKKPHVEVQNYKIFFFTIEIMAESLFLVYLATNLLKRSWSHCRIKIWPEADLLKVKWLPHMWKLFFSLWKFLLQKANQIQNYEQLESFKRTFYCRITLKLSSELNLKHRHVNGYFRCVKAIFIHFHFIS